MKIWPDRHHWINTVLGLLDAAYALSQTEQAVVADALGQLFSALRIPERGCPAAVPLPVLMEYTSKVYSQAMMDRFAAGIEPPPAVVAKEGDLHAPEEAWRSAITSMIFVAYPDLAPEERVAADKVISDVLGALGVPQRRANFIPVDVQNLVTS